MRCVFLTVTDHDFFAGTLATVNSVLAAHPTVDVVVVNNRERGLNAAQLACLASDSQVRVLDSADLLENGRHCGAWELKAYGAAWAAARYDAVVGIDSDCLLCRPFDAEIAECLRTGSFVGGKDGDGIVYDQSYRGYGISTPARNEKYMSTSLYACASTPDNRAILERWAQACNDAVFNGTGALPGHGDQGVLNAVLFATDGSARVRLLDNRLSSQHWVYWTCGIEYCDGVFVNLSAGGRPQQAFHCGGAEKFWERRHRDRVTTDQPLQTYPYVWFLAMLWFGRCRRWDIDPFEYLPASCRHLASDLALFLLQIFQVWPVARRTWEALPNAMIETILHPIPRARSFGSAKMTELIGLIAAHPRVRRFIEVGSHEGATLLALALRFANRDIDFYGVDSFTENTYGGGLPSRQTFVDNLARSPALRARLIPGDFALAASTFDPASVDFVFLHACLDSGALLRAIGAWASVLRPGGVLAGDGFERDSIRRAVAARFPCANVTQAGSIWWTSNADRTSSNGENAWRAHR